MERYSTILTYLRRKVETGESFSNALAYFPHAFDQIVVNQVKVGERSGTLAETLSQLAIQREQAGQLRAQIKKRIAYPLVLMTLGSGVIIFMLIYVVPTFEETYASAGIPLPWITELMINVSDVAKRYGWILIITLIGTIVTLKQLRKNPRIAFKMDLAMLSMPLIGQWLRDIAVLRLMDVLGNLMEAGFTLAEALRESADSIRNRAVRKAVEGLQQAVNRGEKFSREVERHGEMFPPIVSQLVIVGEQTGKLTQATAHIREHLRREIERKTNVMVGTIEPVLTISLATAIAVVLLAIYLPMFDMINTVE